MNVARISQISKMTVQVNGVKFPKCGSVSMTFILMHIKCPQGSIYMQTVYLRTTIFSISCSFLEILIKLYVGTLH